MHLGHGIGADRGLNRVLNVGDVDAPASRGIAVHGEVQVGLADDAEDAQVLDALDRGHLRLNLFSRVLQRAQVVAVKLDGQLAFHAGDGLFHVVGDGLRVVPDDAGKLFQLLVDGGDQRFLVLVEDGAPLLLSLQIDKVFGVEKAGSVGAIVGAPGLAHDLRDLRETRP